MTVKVDIDHEVGDLTEYTATVTDSGDLSAAGGAALAGTGYGLSALIDDTTSIYATAEFSSITSNLVRFRFYYDPNSFTASSTNYWGIFGARVTTTGSYLVFVRVSKSGANYYLGACIYKDDSSYSFQDALITDAPHYIEIYATRAATNVSADGGLSWTIDGAAQPAITGIDNYDRWAGLATVRLGAGVVLTIPAGTAGTIYLDELIVNDDGSEIGPVTSGEAHNAETTIQGRATIVATGTAEATGTAHSVAATIMARATVVATSYAEIDDIALEWEDITAIVQGRATLSGTGRVIAVGNAVIAGAASVVATGEAGRNAQATIQARANVIATGTVTSNAQGAAIIAARATVIATGSITGRVDGAAIISANAAIIASGEAGHEAQASIAGQANLTATGLITANAEATISAQAGVIATGLVTVNAETTIACAATLSATATVSEATTSHSAVATLAGYATVTTTGLVGVEAQAVIYANANLSAIPPTRGTGTRDVLYAPERATLYLPARKDVLIDN